MFTEKDVIFRYTRKQAIEDGVLIDVTSAAQEAGIGFPVAVTDTLWSKYIEPDENAKKQGETENWRLWDVVYMFRLAAENAAGNVSETIFKVAFPMEGSYREVELKAVCGPGDDAEPVITIMLPNED